MVERNLDSSDTTLRNSVVFKVVQALRHSKQLRLVRIVEKRKGICVRAPGEATTGNASLPVALPLSADRRGERPPAPEAIIPVDHRPVMH
ncbi:MAG: hypothetical protein AAF968_07500 [Pseudomonadota bacterium]